MVGIRLDFFGKQLFYFFNNSNLTEATKDTKNNILLTITDDDSYLQLKGNYIYIPKLQYITENDFINYKDMRLSILSNLLKELDVDPKDNFAEIKLQPSILEDNVNIAQYFLSQLKEYNKDLTIQDLFIYTIELSNSIDNLINKLTTYKRSLLIHDGINKK